MLCCDTALVVMIDLLAISHLALSVSLCLSFFVLPLGARRVRGSLQGSDLRWASLLLLCCYCVVGGFLFCGGGCSVSSLCCVVYPCFRC